MYYIVNFASDVQYVVGDKTSTDSYMETLKLSKEFLPSFNLKVDLEVKSYIGTISLDQNILSIDQFEFITSGDKERIEELGLSQSDMPNGYYIHNESDKIISFTVDEKAEFTFFDTANLFVSENEDKKYTTRDKEEFIKFLYGNDDSPRKSPFWIKIKGDKIISVVEEFVN